MNEYERNGYVVGATVRQIVSVTGRHDDAKILSVHSNGGLDVECVLTGVHWGWSVNFCELVCKTCDGIGDVATNLTEQLHGKGVCKPCPDCYKE